MKTFLIGASALALSVGAASASSVTFDLSSNPYSYILGEADFTLSSGGLSVEVDAILCGDGAGPNDASCKDARVDRWRNGLGLDFDGWRGSRDIHQVDGQDRTEFIELSFNQVVTLDKAAFTYFHELDDFRLYSYSGGMWVDQGNFDACESGCAGWNGTIQTYDFTTMFSGTRFLFGATEADDAWKFRSVTVTPGSSNPPPPVPLPAAGWLLVGGLAGLMATRRRKG